MVDTYSVPDRFKGSTTFDPESYQKLYEYSIAEPEKFWAERASEIITWESKWHSVLSWDYGQGRIRWFEGATLNVAANCVDRHLLNHSDKIAILWEGNTPGESASLTYQQLHTEVCKYANLLQKKGIQKGDRIALYMPMVPELAIAMLAAARIGAVHTVIFAGFSADSLRDRILDCECKLLITSNEGCRGDKRIPLKKIVDTALTDVACIQSVLIHRRTDTDVPFVKNRDEWLHEALEGISSDHLPVAMDAEDPLFILYTSGSTGKPKGVLHTCGGYLLYCAYTHRTVFDLQEDDIYFCAADIGWITGHSYIVYGPLANATTTVLFESTPVYPDAGRYWDVISRLGVTIFYTAPTAIRTVAKEGNSLVEKYDLSSLRILGSVGEPINEDAWKWYFSVVGKEQCTLVDTWWQTETGGILISPLPGVTTLKPGSATRPLFGIRPVLVDDNGSVIEGNDQKGRLCIDFPWPGQMRTVYGDHQRFIDTYFKDVPGMYCTGDASHRDQSGDYWIIGRVDDVVNVSGHRLGTAEIETALVHSGKVAEAAVVGIPHEVKGTALHAFCILMNNVPATEETENIVRNAVRSAIGPFAAPDTIQFVPGLPKTRSGKIMRRILRKIASGAEKEIGDISTLADPSIVEDILRGMQEPT